MIRRLCIVLAVLSVGLGACRSTPDTTAILVVTPRGGDPIFGRINGTLDSHFTKLIGESPVHAELPADADFDDLCATAEEHGALIVIAMGIGAVFPGDATTVPPTNHRHGFHLRTNDDGAWRHTSGEKGATFLRLTAADASLPANKKRIPLQIGAYEILRRFGVRFFHPEQPFVPELGTRHDQLRDLARRPTAIAPKTGPTDFAYIPDFSERGFSFHGSHPLEHLEAFSDSQHPIDEAVRVNEWIIANRGNQFRGAGRGIAKGERRQKRVDALYALRDELGFAWGTGITLHNQQQGASAAIDPSSKTPVKEQIEALVKKRIGTPGSHESFGIHFGPTEFTVTPDKETVQWINWAGQAALKADPNIRVLINNHTSGGQATANFSDLGCPPNTNGTGTCDYYDLSFHTDKRLGVKVHTVMFQPLVGPAPVYNQKTFAHKLCLMKKASAEGRPLSWFPEGSWWLSYDNPIPVYLPLYIATRGKDIELVRPLLTTRGGSLYAHRMFNSGHEWGYWQQDYAVGMWHWNANVTMDAVLDEIFDPLCDTPRASCTAKTTAIEVLKEVTKHQWEVFLDAKDHRGQPGGLFNYFAGEDPADDLAAVTGFEFRAVRVAFAKVAKMKENDLDKLQGIDLAALAKAASLYEGWVKRLRKLSVPASGKKWLDEVIDGLEINMLRARQSNQLYRAVVAMKQGLKGDLKTFKDAATKTLADAEKVIRRREKAYRYPAAQTHGGGLTPATKVANGTTYPWRVHTKTHLLTYWKSRHEQAMAVLSGKSTQFSEKLRLSPAIGAPGTAVKVQWPKLNGLQATVAMGNGKSIDETTSSFDYGKEPGAWLVSGQMTTEGRTIGVKGAIARTPHVGTSKAAAFELKQPDSAIAQSVLKTLFPAFSWAVVAKNALVFGPDVDGDGTVEFFDLVVAPLADPASADVVTKPVDFSMPIADPATGDSTVSLSLTKVVLAGAVGTDGVAKSLKMSGQMSVTDLVNALIDLAGFDEKGAYQTLGGVLKFDPKKPPKTVPFAGVVSLAD